MSLVTVKRSPETVTPKSSKVVSDDLILNKSTTTSLFSPNPTGKSASITNRFSLNLNRFNNIKNNNNESKKESSLSFTLTATKTNNENSNSTNTNNNTNASSNLVNTRKKNFNNEPPKRCSFNLDERPFTISSNFKDLKALYSSSSSTPSSSSHSSSCSSSNSSLSTDKVKSFNRSSINSNTIPYVKKNPKNYKNSSLINRHSLNLPDRQSLCKTSSAEIEFKSRIDFESRSKNDEDDDVSKTIKPLESNLNLNSTVFITNNNRNLIEKYFVVKDAALILPRRSCSNINKNSNENLSNNSTLIRPNSLLIPNEDETSKTDQDTSSSSNNLNSSVSSSTGDILIHLQSMISLLRPNDTIILAVKLFSYVQEKTRYLVIVETQSNKSSDSLCEESAILGLDLTQISNQTDLDELNGDKESENKNDSNEKLPNKQFICTVGLVLPIYANCEISLDGDGGFRFKSHQSTHIFKPVSIQAMWSAYQYLHKAFENARKCNYYPIQTSLSSSPSNSSSPSFNSNNTADFSSNSTNLLNEQQVQQQQQQADTSNHDWVKYYSSLIGKYKSEQQSINEWYQKEERSAQREDFTTPYFDSLQLCKEQEETGLKIKEKLKEIMISSKDDYGSMSSVYIREILEKELQLKLDSFKKFIDATIFQFYNQLVECATKILPYLYLGTEWNASNYDSLMNDGVTHILNVSSEVDNFFPDTFKYLNIRVLDINETDLLKEFDRTNKFIQEAKEQNSSCLVHCKMGVSRSASVVLAFLMKESGYTYEQAFNFTKQKRACINPNDSFRQQLTTYESILNAHRAKYNLFEPSPQTSSTSILSGIPQTNLSEPENSKVSENVDVINQSGLSVKEAINKIKSMSSSDQLNVNSQLQPPLSPINLKKQQNSNLVVSTANTSPPFVSRKFLSLSPTNINITENSTKISPNNLDAQTDKETSNNKNPSQITNQQHQLRNSMDDSPKSSSSLKSVKNNSLNNNEPNQNLDQNFNISCPSDSNLKHAQSCPNQMSGKQTTFVRRLAKEIDTQTPSDNNINTQQQTSYFDPCLDTALTNNVSSVNFTLSTENLEDSNSPTLNYTYVPAGTVKRQVESINIKSKPIEYALIRQSTIEFETKTTNLNLDQEQKITQQTTTSPDSKRFKCEQLQLLNSDLDKVENCLDNLDDEENSVQSRSSEVNRYKKLFEQFELQKDIDREDKMKKTNKSEKIEDTSTFKNNNRQSKLNATIS